MMVKTTVTQIEDLGENNRNRDKTPIPGLEHE